MAKAKKRLLSAVRSLRSPSWYALGNFLVFLIVLAMLCCASSIWRFTPDSGIYVGTAFEMIENQRYWFNYNPNLVYYPGTSFMLALILALPGDDFLSLNIYLALQAAVIFFLFSRYYRPANYGLAATFGLVLFASNGLMLAHAFIAHSDGLFFAAGSVRLSCVASMPGNSGQSFQVSDPFHSRVCLTGEG